MHTQSGICGLRGLHWRNGFYTVQTVCAIALHLNLALTGTLCIFWFSKKTPFSMFFKPFGLRGHRQCPHKPPSCFNTHVIIQICVLINHIYRFSHTHTHTHTHSLESKTHNQLCTISCAPEMINLVAWACLIFLTFWFIVSLYWYYKTSSVYV